MVVSTAHPSKFKDTVNSTPSGKILNTVPESVRKLYTKKQRKIYVSLDINKILEYF